MHFSLSYNFYTLIPLDNTALALNKHQRSTNKIQYIYLMQKYFQTKKRHSHIGWEYLIQQQMFEYLIESRLITMRSEPDYVEFV